MPAQSSRQNHARLEMVDAERTNFEAADQTVAKPVAQRYPYVVVAQARSAQIKRCGGAYRGIDADCLSRDCGASANRHEIEPRAGNESQTADRKLRPFASCGINGRDTPDNH